MGNLSYIHKAMKDKDPGDFDLDEKRKIAGLLKREFDLNMLYDEVLYFDKETGKLSPTPDGTKEEILEKYEIHYPDGWIRDKEVAVEIDGPVHWQNTKAVKNTNKRNACYDRAKLKFIWFTREEVQKCNDEFLTRQIGEQLGREFAKK